AFALSVRGDTEQSTCLFGRVGHFELLAGLALGVRREETVKQPVARGAILRRIGSGWECAPPAGLRVLLPGGSLVCEVSAVELVGCSGEGGEDWWAGWERAAALFGEPGVVAEGAAGGWWGGGVLGGARGAIPPRRRAP